VRDGIRVGKRFGIEFDIGYRAVFGGDVVVAVLLEPGLEFSLGRLLDRLDERGWKRDHLDGAALALMQRHRPQEGIGHGQSVGHRLNDLLSLGDPLAVVEIVLRAHADLAQHPIELAPVEATVRAVEGRILRSQLRQAVLRKAKAHLARLFVQQRAGHQLAHHLLVDAEELRLLARYVSAILLRQEAQLPVIGEPVVDDRDIGLAGSQHGVAAALHHLAGNAPDRETQHQQAEENLDQ
jgi:hypothetical protein